MNAPVFKHTVETCEQVHKVSFAVAEIVTACGLLNHSLGALTYAMSREQPPQISAAAGDVHKHANAIAILAASISKGLNGGQNEQR